MPQKSLITHAAFLRFGLDELVGDCAGSQESGIVEGLTQTLIMLPDGFGDWFTVNPVDPQAEDYEEIHPQEKQIKFLASEADICIYGGAAGSGKSYAVLLEPLNHIENDRFNAVIFRRTFPEIRNAGGLWDTSNEIYPHCNAIPNQSQHSWQFPSGAKVTFSHLQLEKNQYSWQGAQVPLIVFDELTHFTESQFWYLLSRNRSTCGVKPYIRATTNPDADSWVADLISWWIDSEGFPIPERSGVLRWFVRVSGDLIWADSREELEKLHPDLIPKSLSFISATIEDNAALIEANPDYRANLQALHPVERARLLEGNWKINYEAGTIFDRTWFRIIEQRELPQPNSLLRCWDIAATDKSVAKKTSFYTAGAKGFMSGGNLYIVDVVWEQIGPAKVPEWIASVAQQDGYNCGVRWELEGGSESRIAAATVFDSALRGFNKAAISPRGSKIERATPWASAAYHGRVYLVRGPWVDQFLSACQQFDGSAKPLVNDVVDAVSLLWHQSQGASALRRGSATTY